MKGKKKRVLERSEHRSVACTVMTLTRPKSLLIKVDID